MAQAPVKMLTFEEFAAPGMDGRYELVNGSLEELVPFSPFQSRTGGRIAAVPDPDLDGHDPAGFWGAELDFPTIPFHGRRPDFVDDSAQAAARGLDFVAQRATGVPTLAVEVLPDGDEARDLVTRRVEYAQAGIPHTWILDPHARTALTLVLRENTDEVAGEFSGDAAIPSLLFPGLEIPLRRLFR
jgi:Uma2 family endonuclease